MELCAWVQAFKGMDTVIAEAARNNVKLVIALMNNWNYNPLQTDWKCAPGQLSFLRRRMHVQVSVSRG